MHIFISYAKVDTQPLALKIRDTLRSVNGLTAWMDESLESGEDWAVQIQDEIDQCDLMLVLMSPDVNRTSEPRSFVLREIHYAQDNHKPILPVMAQKTKIPVQLAGIQFVDLTQNQAVGVETLVENVCRRFGLVSPAEQKRQAEEVERQRVAEVHRQTVEAEQKRQAEEQEQRRQAQAQLEAQRRANEQARHQNAPTAPAMPVMQPRPNAPQDWNKQYSDGSSAAYQAKVSAAGPRKSAVGIPLLAGGAVIAALLLIVVVGVLLSGVLGGDKNNNANDGLGKYQAIFAANQLITLENSDGAKHVCSYHNITLGDDSVDKWLHINEDSISGSYTNLVEIWFMRSKIGKFQTTLTPSDSDVQFIYDNPWQVDKAGNYVICFSVPQETYDAKNKFADFSAWINITLTNDR